MDIIEAKCPCGSGFLASECCIPIEAPVSMRNSGYNSINIDTSLVDDLGHQLYLGNSVGIKVTFRNPHQINKVIGDYCRNTSIVISSKYDPTQARPIYFLLQELDNSLHATKYRQQQLLFRYRLLYGEHVFAVKVKGNADVEIEDIPLRVEFEDYISKVRTTLDVLARFLSSGMNGNSWNNGKLYLYLQNYKGKDSMTGQLKKLYCRFNPWMKELKTLRDSIQHEGKASGFESIKHVKDRVKKPVINNLDLGEQGIKIWKNLFELVGESTKIVFHGN